MSYEDFLTFLDKNVNPFVRTLQEQYLEDVPHPFREHYQFGKLTEEIGEFVQALYAERRGPSSVTPNTDCYESLRGTIPSEAADVVLSALSLLIIKKLSVTRCRDFDIDVDEVELVANELHRAIAYEEASRAISVLYHYCEENKYDIRSHVLARAIFNLERMEKENG